MKIIFWSKETSKRIINDENFYINKYGMVMEYHNDTNNRILLSRPDLQFKIENS